VRCTTIEYAQRLGPLKHCLALNQPLANYRSKPFMMSIDGKYETREWLDAFLSVVDTSRVSVVGDGLLPLLPDGGGGPPAAVPPPAPATGAGDDKVPGFEGLSGVWLLSVADEPATQGRRRARARTERMVYTYRGAGVACLLMSCAPGCEGAVQVAASARGVAGDTTPSGVGTHTNEEVRRKIAAAEERVAEPAGSSSSPPPETSKEMPPAEPEGPVAGSPAPSRLATGAVSGNPPADTAVDKAADSEARAEADKEAPSAVAGPTPTTSSAPPTSGAGKPRNPAPRFQPPPPPPRRAQPPPPSRRMQGGVAAPT